MQYLARVTTRVQWTDRETGKVRENFQTRYLDAFSKADALNIVEGLKKGGCPHHQSNGCRYSRSYDVVAAIWNGKGNTYLDLAALEQIAEEYTAPQQEAAE